jgi:hypothetical protein
MLNEMRFGAVSEDTVERFRSLSATVEYPDGVLPTVRTRLLPALPHRPYELTPSLTTRRSSFRCGRRSPRAMASGWL